MEPGPEQDPIVLMVCSTPERVSRQAPTPCTSEIDRRCSLRNLCSVLQRAAAKAAAALQMLQTGCRLGAGAQSFFFEGEAGTWLARKTGDLVTRGLVPG